MGFVFDAVKGIAHERCKNVRIGEPAHLPQKARDQSEHQLIREHPAKNASKQCNGISGDRQIFDAEFFGHGIDDECADAGHGAGNHRVNSVHQGGFCASQQKLDVKILYIAALEIIHNAADCGKSQQNHIVLVAEERLQLLLQGNIFFAGLALL